LVCTGSGEISFPISCNFYHTQPASSIGH
jgi:hypothetical protein